MSSSRNPTTLSGVLIVTFEAVQTKVFEETSLVSKTRAVSENRLYYFLERLETGIEVVRIFNSASNIRISEGVL